MHQNTLGVKNKQVKQQSIKEPHRKGCEIKVVANWKASSF